MKKQGIIFSIIGAIFISIATSCSDFLQVSSVSLLQDKDVYSNPDSANQAIASIYDIIGQNNSYRNRLWLQMGLNTDIEYRPGWADSAVVSDSKADDCLAFYSSTSSLAEGYNNADAANPWSRIYQGIERANLAIAGIREHGQPAAGNDMGQLLGEALTMRAFFYYDLIKWWGDVPARFEPVSQNTIYLPKSDRNIIYDQIITDLQEAATILNGPNEKYTVATTRISKDAARGLLARICLSAAGYSMRPIAGTSDSEIKISVSDARRTELYTIARKACKDIITDGKYKLDSSFKNIFYEQCQDNQTQGRETIWQLPYYMGVRGRMLYNLALPRDADNIFTKSTIGGQFKIIPSFFYDYNVNDTRRNITVVPYKVAKNSTLNVMEQSISSGILGFNIGKWRAEWIKTPISGTDDGVSPIVLRYADVLLMFAEADLFLSGNEGTEYFNMVRRRAFGQPITAASPYDLPLTLENIKAERAFELCGENIRKYDLERWGELKSGIDKAKANLTALRDATDNYSTVPAIIYYKWIVPATPVTPGERELVVYGLNRGETDDKTAIDPTGGWTKKTWTRAMASKTDPKTQIKRDTEMYLSDAFIRNLYHRDPDKHQLLPIMNQIITTSNGTLVNNYGY
jgi:starch-binding outer membrane protein, SusD/RagB family